MEQDAVNVPEGKFVIITSNVEDPDNAKLYIKSTSDFSFITDMSGATGIQGPQGIQGIQGIQGPAGQNGINGHDGQDGTNGVTPHIDSTTGNWFIGSTDTGVHAQGPQGQQGPAGSNGQDAVYPTLATVATSGSYNDLTNKPTIPQIWTGTQSQYDALSSYDSNTIYIIS